ncbi:MAG: YraN family protein [Gammaproteobacteria bacterium]|nr:YraN family protein [Gammaproteobacteria bacterium]
MAKESREIGQAAESWCKQFLSEKGLEFVAENFHSRYGEIDLIFLDKSVEPKTLVFVEVRYRRSKNFGAGFETVTHHKQKKIIKTAQIFLQKDKQFTNHNVRFDVVSISSKNKNFKADWQSHAFEANAW